MAVPPGSPPTDGPGTAIMSGRFLDEPKLLALGYDLEQELGKRKIPKFLGSVPGPFPDAGICAALPTGAPAADRAASSVRSMSRVSRPRL